MSSLQYDDPVRYRCLGRATSNARTCAICAVHGTAWDAPEYPAKVNALRASLRALPVGQETIATING